MPARAVLINADDLGLWPSVTAGIFAAWAAHVIGDSTAFAHADDLAHLLAQAGAMRLPVGIHLNLTYGRPLSDPAEIPALVTPDGVFMRRQAWALPLPADQVRRELTRQAERFLALGWSPSHLDSHHHIHTYPDILAIVIELAQALRLPVRATNPEMRAALRKAGIPTPDHFSMAFYGEGATVDTLMHLVETCPGGTLEIMTHPGYADPGLPGSYRDDRARELAALTDTRWRQYLAERDISGIGFRDLAHS